MKQHANAVGGGMRGDDAATGDAGRAGGEEIDLAAEFSVS